MAVICVSGFLWWAELVSVSVFILVQFPHYLLNLKENSNPHLQLEHSCSDRPQKKAYINLNWQLAVGLVDLLLWLLQKRIRVSAKGFREAQFSLQYTASSKRGRPSFVFLGLCFSLLQTGKHTKTKCFWLISSGLISLCVTQYFL